MTSQCRMMAISQNVAQPKLRSATLNDLSMNTRRNTMTSVKGNVVFVAKGSVLHPTIMHTKGFVKCFTQEKKTT